jgi:hypothetical protein
MKAADALGLLAGLGALSALRGGREGAGKRFTGLIDMLDGGGAGASGDRFEGGGLLSVLGNLFAKPLEAQDNIERIARDTNAITQRDRMSAAMADEARRRGLLQDALDPRGVSQMRPMAPVGSGRGTMGMPMQGSGRGTMDMPMPPSAPVGSGRGTMDMPMPPQNYESTLRQRIGMDMAPTVDADSMPTSSVQSYKSDPQFMSVAEKDATFLSMPEAARQNIYNMYLQRRNMQ